VRKVISFAASTRAFVSIEHEDLADALERCVANDWGDVSPATKQCNEEALKNGGRLDGQYVDRHGVTFFITSTRNGMPRVTVAKND